MPRLATSQEPLLAPPDPTDSQGGHAPEFERISCLWRCVHAAKAWLDVFYVIPPAVYVGFPWFCWFQLIRCLIILKHLSTFDDPAWDPNIVYSTVDMLSICDKIADKAEDASRDSGEQGPDDLFRQVASVLRRCQAWVHARQRAAAQAAEGPVLAGANDFMAEVDQMPWMEALESGNESWFEDFLGWSPGTL